MLWFPGPRSHGSQALASPDPEGPCAVPLYVAGQRVPDQFTLVESPVRDGAVVSLGSPEGCFGAGAWRAGGDQGDERARRRLDLLAARRTGRYRQR